MTDQPNWRPPISSGVDKPLRQLSLEELLHWADRSDVMVDELVRRIESLRATNRNVVAERSDVYDALSTAEQRIRVLQRQLDDALRAFEDQAIQPANYPRR